tara:strand:+ start:565 stop:1344 length:780 start_codon:yes stop_codon:yes gene_type:complete
MIWSDLKFAYHSRSSWWFTATARTRARFSKTILGNYWLGLSNLLSIISLGLVYGVVFSVDDFRSYFVYLGLGIVLWNSLAGSINSAPELFSHNAQNIKNTNVPVIFYTFEEWSFHVQIFLQSFSLVFIFMLFFKFHLLINLIVSAWFPLINFILFIYWFPLIICILSIWYTDISQLVPVILQILFLVSPILYKKENLGDLLWISNINLPYQVISQIRDCIIFGEINFSVCFFLFALNLLGLYLSLFILQRQKKYLPFFL